MPARDSVKSFSIIFPRRKAGQSSRGPAQPVIVNMSLLKVIGNPAVFAIRNFVGAFLCCCPVSQLHIAAVHLPPHHARCCMFSDGLILRPLTTSHITLCPSAGAVAFATRNRSRKVGSFPDGNQEGVSQARRLPLADENSRRQQRARSLVVYDQTEDRPRRCSKDVFVFVCVFVFVTAAQVVVVRGRACSKRSLEAAQPGPHSNSTGASTCAVCIDTVSTPIPAGGDKEIRQEEGCDGTQEQGRASPCCKKFQGVGFQRTYRGWAASGPCSSAQVDHPGVGCSGAWRRRCGGAPKRPSAISAEPVCPKPRDSVRGQQRGGAARADAAGHAHIASADAADDDDANMGGRFFQVAVSRRHICCFEPDFSPVANGRAGGERGLKSCTAGSVASAPSALHLALHELRLRHGRFRRRIRRAQLGTCLRDLQVDNVKLVRGPHDADDGL